MSAVERVQAAIDKLDKLKADSTPEPWVYGLNDPFYSIIHSADDQAVAHVGSAPVDGILIVTLHATIDAQLAILQEAIRQASDRLFKFPFTTYDRAAIALADSILRADS